MASESEGVHRLSNITVEEVSLVDRAANKRKFLIAKREGSTDMSQLRSDGRGGFTKVTKADGEEETEKAKKPPFPGAAKPFGAKDEEDEKKKKDAEEEEKKKSAKADESLSKRVGDIAKELGELSKEMDDDGDYDGDEAMKRLIAAHKSVSGLIAKYLKTATKSATPGEVKKVGAKMAATRLSLLKEALDSLQSLFAELSDSPAKQKDHAPDAGDPQAAPPGWNKGNPSGAPGNAEGAAAIKALNAKIDEIANELISSNETLVTANKRLSKRCNELENQVVPGNSRTVEKSTKSATDLAWPLDMAADITKRDGDPDRFD